MFLLKEEEQSKPLVWQNNWVANLKDIPNLLMELSVSYRGHPMQAFGGKTTKIFEANAL